MGLSELPLRRACPRLIDTTVGKAFMLRRLLFPFRSFSSLLLITSPRTARLASVVARQEPTICRRCGTEGIRESGGAVTCASRPSTRKTGTGKAGPVQGDGPSAASCCHLPGKSGNAWPARRRRAGRAGAGGGGEVPAAQCQGSRGHLYSHTGICS
ncbi:unnamed protein product [Rangifer tarandus platyrhynchus]|uniref:Uncharacterized protein n=2 Tax=Rangifer tarandus platyrhynchus TaxID=3082113 RepID=A0ABN8ZDR0_RANTA|nr:unnamed protein product [Rangifer tarandus platyrhynchus]CAI9707273.1 unnamed protein product [Rangifer tarandus platyrhynchus]